MSEVISIRVDTSQFKKGLRRALKTLKRFRKKWSDDMSIEDAAIRVNGQITKSPLKTLEEHNEEWMNGITRISMGPPRMQPVPPQPTRQQLVEIAEASVELFTPPMRRGGILMSEEARVEHKRLEELSGLLHAAGFWWEEYT